MKIKFNSDDDLPINKQWHMVLFLLEFFYYENLSFYYAVCIFFYFYFYIFINITISKFAFKIYTHQPFKFFHILLYFSKSCSTLTLIDIVIVFLFSLNSLIQSGFSDSFKHNGLITSLSLYSVRYISELFLLYGSLLETNILLTSISSTLNIFFLVLL